MLVPLEGPRFNYSAVLVVEGNFEIVTFSEGRRM